MKGQKIGGHMEQGQLVSDPKSHAFPAFPKSYPSFALGEWDKNLRLLKVTVSPD
jgi:hypothetical protein